VLDVMAVTMAIMRPRLCAMQIMMESQSTFAPPDIPIMRNGLRKR
jgi:hypothetical protein